MLYLISNNKKIDDAKAAHWTYFKCRIRKKIGNGNCSNSCKICRSTRPLNNPYESIHFATICHYLSNSSHLDDIVNGLPNLLLGYNSAFFDHVIPGRYNEVDTYFNTKRRRAQLYPEIHSLILTINSIFNYDEFSGRELGKDYCAYDLAGSLDKRSCTYCNRTYTNTFSTGKKKIMRPTLDHWYPRSKYPLLGVSFYNLIPSCHTCNSSVKSDVELDLHNHVHPYIDQDQVNAFKFKYFYSNKLNKYRIFLTPTDIANRKTFDTVKKMYIDEMYNSHHDELEDLIKIKQAYSDKYIEKLQNLFPNNDLGPNEVYRLLFGTELDSKDFQNRPLSKFKSDILRELGIIK